MTGLPIYQTLSILSAFLLFISSALIVYSSNSDYWISENFRLKTYDVGKMMEETWPSTPKINTKTARKGDDCKIFSKLASFFTKQKRGKIRFNVNAGLKDFCIHFKLQDYGTMVDTFQPSMHYCRNHTFLYYYGEHRKIHNDHKQPKSVQFADRMVDVVSECSDLLTAFMVLNIVATCTALIKTPMILNKLRWNRILEFGLFVVLIGAVISGLWCIILFYTEFDPQGFLQQVKKEQLNTDKVKKNSVLKKIVNTLYFEQRYGQALFLTILSVIIALIVSVLTVIEYKLTLKETRRKKGWSEVGDDGESVDGDDPNTELMYKGHVN